MKPKGISRENYVKEEFVLFILWETEEFETMTGSGQ